MRVEPASAPPTSSPTRPPRTASDSARAAVLFARIALLAAPVAGCDDDATTTGTGGASSSTNSGTSTSTASTVSSSTGGDLCATVDCAPPGACQLANTCNPSTGRCEPTLVDDGTACDDGQSCTHDDVCTAGVCGGVTLTCPADASCVAGACVAAACTTRIGLPGPPRFDGDAAAVLDFDGDGIPDALTIHPFGVDLLSGDGGGFFHFTQSFAISGQPTSPRVADLDGNGKPDLAIGNLATTDVGFVFDDGSVSALAGLASPPVSIALANVGGSVLPDVVAFTANGDWQVFLNLGNKAFAAGATGTVLSAPRDADAADLDGDGKVDVAVATANGVVVLRGNGTGGFFIPSTFGSSNFNSITAADLDGDGKPDLSATTGSSAVILRNDGGTFTLVNSIPTHPVDGVRHADLDGNGAPDLVFHEACTDLGCGAGHNDSATVILNAGGFGFTAVGLAERAPGPGGLVLADLNGDTKTDALVGGGGTVTPLLQSASGVLQGPPITTTPGAAALTSGDFNGDGRSDFIVSTHPTVGQFNTFDLYENLGAGVAPTKTSVATSVSEPAPTHLASADIDHDGHLDLVFVDRGTLGWALNPNGTGALDAPQTVSLTVNGNITARALHLLDLDGDKNLDALVALGGATSLVTVRHLGAAPTVENLPTNPLVALASADFDEDGDADVVVGVAASPGLVLLLNDGAGGFSPTPYGAIPAARAVAAGDLDGDGHADVVVADDTQVRLLFGDGQGGFPSVDVLDGGVTNDRSLAIVDADTDGLPDIVLLSDLRNDVTLLRHTGPRAFSPARYSVTSRPYGLATGDFDGDARPDVVVGADTFANLLLTRCAP